MKITAIRLANVGGVREINMPCGSVTIASGANGSGKSSIVNAIANVFNGGHEPDMIGPHGDKATIEIDLDNGVKIRRVITRKDSTYSVTTRDGSTVKSPAKFVQGLVTGLALNPTGLVDAPQKDRVKFLQNAMPISFHRQEVATAAEYENPLELPEYMDIQQFNAFRQGRYDQRTDINRAVKELQSTQQTIMRSLPEDDGTDWRAAVTQKQADLIAAKDELSQLRRGAERDVETLRAEIRETLQAKIDEIRARMQLEIDAAKSEADTELAKLEERAKSVLANEEAPILERINQLTADLATAREKDTAQQRVKGVRESLEQIEQQMYAKGKLSSKLDRVIEKLDDLKKQKLDALPIPGVEVRDGQIYYNGLNFDTQLNTAQKYLLSFQVAALTLGELPFMIFDGAEALDAANREEFIEAIKGAGFQVVMAEVRSGEPLAVSVA